LKKFYTNIWVLIGFVVCFILVSLGIHYTQVYNKQRKHTFYSAWSEGRQNYLKFIEKNDTSENIEAICHDLMEKHFNHTFYFGLFPVRPEKLKEPFLEGCLHEKVKNDDTGFRIVFFDENPS
jgi:hypothetical protein